MIWKWVTQGDNSKKTKKPCVKKSKKKKEKWRKWQNDNVRWTRGGKSSWPVFLDCHAHHHHLQRLTFVNSANLNTPGALYNTPPIHLCKHLSFNSTTTLLSCALFRFRSPPTWAPLSLFPPQFLSLSPVRPVASKAHPFQVSEMELEASSLKPSIDLGSSWAFQLDRRLLWLMMACFLITSPHSLSSSQAKWVSEPHYTHSFLLNCIFFFLVGPNQ